MKNQAKPVHVDLSKIPNMKCYCGADVFTKVFNLKYISPILCQDPKGGTAVVFMYRCTLCGQIYPTATTAAEVEKLYNNLPPERRAFVDKIKEQLKSPVLEMTDGGLYTGPPKK